MDWTSTDALVTVNGLHVMLWVLAYGAWRFLRGPRWEQQAQSAAEAPRVRTRRASRVPNLPTAERMQRRAAMLAKIQRPGRPPAEQEMGRRRKAA